MLEGLYKVLRHGIDSVFIESEGFSKIFKEAGGVQAVEQELNNNDYTVKAFAKRILDIFSIGSTTVQNED